MNIFLISLVTSTLVSSILSFIYYKKEVRKQKAERQKRWEKKKQEYKDSHPELFSKMNDML